MVVTEGRIELPQQQRNEAGVNEVDMLCPKWMRAPHPRMACHAPKMTLRQICHMLRMMRKMRSREAGPGGMSRKQTSPLPPPSSPVTKATERRCLPACLRRRRNGNIKRVG
ncbi:hypothetical protein AGOR_G00006700 [Albula goreensis]|uniref:Uncharacterized protein n=1 Tax=Albula goreensis TaxID=1534307 RepID=A0A8T3E547_9TELE|nr:hypothetical protein AGOR_G00006700 [Albula goreensis]